MRATDQEVEYVRFEHVAPDEIWAEIVSLFVSSFAAPPYNEAPDALQSIAQWGPAALASPGGAAYRGETRRTRDRLRVITET
jgi:hypothetical protein